MLFWFNSIQLSSFYSLGFCRFHEKGWYFLESLEDYADMVGGRGMRTH